MRICHTVRKWLKLKMNEKFLIPCGRVEFLLKKSVIMDLKIKI